MRTFVAGDVREVLGADEVAAVGGLLGRLHSARLHVDLPTAVRRLPPDFADALSCDADLRAYSDWLAGLQRDASPLLAAATSPELHLECIQSW